MKITRSLIAMALSLVMIFSIVNVEAAGNVTYPSGVTEDMINASYWKNITTSPDQLLMTFEDIQAFNQITAQVAETNLVDLEQVTDVNKGEFEKFERDLFINGIQINESDYIAKFEAGHEQMPLTYAVAVKRTDLKSWPTTEVLGYTADDPDDELELSIVEVNEPFIIGGKCEVDGKTFYYGTSSSCDGWVDAENLALFDSKDEWLDAWKVDFSGDDFLVVAQDKITLESMLLAPEISGTELYLGTILKLVPEAEIPEKIGERTGNWFNYVVYIPTRDENGKYVKKPALIQQKYSVSIGFLPFTQANFLDLALSKLGNRYGWGGMMKSEDSSMYSKAILRCFGIDLPRNTSWQRAMAQQVDISEMSTEEKLAYLKTLPAGAILYFPGFNMHYLGMVNEIPYVISDCGVISDSDGELDVQRRYTVMITPLTVRRRNGMTWLESIDKVLNLSNGTFDVTKGETTFTVSPAKTTVTLDGKNKTVTFKVTELSTGSTTPTFAIKSVSNGQAAKVSVNKSTGKVTLKSGITNCVVTINVTSAENTNRKALTKTVTITVQKGATTFTVSPVSKTYKASALKKKAQSLTIKVSKLSNGSSKPTFSLKSVTKGQKSKVSVNKTTGKVTLKKGIKKCTVKINVTSAANASRKALTKVVTLTVK